MFLKPSDSSFESSGDGEGGSWKEDRIAADDTTVPTFFYQTNPSLSIERQRQRLPIFTSRNHLLYLIESFQTVVVVGETGCGKSTQVPQYLLEAGWCSEGKMVGVTQPRRVAVTSLATRVADEKACKLGTDVGYSIRFDDCWSPGRTKIKFMTEGILIREMMSDPLLTNYSAILVDEVHERSVDTDILLGLLRKVGRRRPDLRLLVASATLDAEELRVYFDANSGGKDRTRDTATIVGVQGRMFSVDVFYVERPVADYVKACADTAIKIHRTEGPGDVLVFLTGQEEVEYVVSMLWEEHRREADPDQQLLVLPLYGALSPKEQLKVFHRTPRNTRKIVVATNVAEASLTIDGIVYVVDCGFVKLRWFNPTTSTDTLAIVEISKASAEQRAGRAGRIRSGKVYRLYTEADYDKLPNVLPPEMQRSNLAFPILQLKALGIENLLRFHFPSSPPSKNFVAALDVLHALGAIGENGNLTEPLGMSMAEFPLNPCFSKMLLISGEFGCSKEAAAICAMLQVRSVFIYIPGRGNEARKAKRRFAVAEGDMITLLNVYEAFVKNGRRRQWCETNFLNFKALTRATKIAAQLGSLLSRCKVPAVSADGDLDSVCRCITAGFFPNAAYLHHSGVYKTVCGDHTMHIHQNSVLYTEKQPSWIVFSEVMLTSKEYMHDVTVIEPQWLCSLAPHYYQFGTNREILEGNA